MQTNEIFHVIGTDLLDYSFKVEQAIKEGWTFSDKSEYCPRAWPHMFEAFMIMNTNDEGPVKTNHDTVVEDATIEVKKTAKSGRPAKK